ncbi:hypothetical protein F4859DRAFT_518221 [Xylaria cf. heliscus]|nr:hypothetical protein F4859DRAFT_518221 [Xylaria cf. heliscus]
MTPRKMDRESVQRITKARGQNDSFARRAEMAARNYDSSSRNEQTVGPSETKNVEEEKKGDEKNTKSESGQDSQDV